MNLINFPSTYTQVYLASEGGRGAEAVYLEPLPDLRSLNIEVVPVKLLTPAGNRIHCFHFKKLDAKGKKSGTATGNADDSSSALTDADASQQNTSTATNTDRGGVRRRKTLVFSHGNSTDIGLMFFHFRDLCSKCDVDIFAYEYSGYGTRS